MGITTAYLSVVVGNSPAENLYDKLDLSEVCRYWYRKLPNKIIEGMRNLDLVLETGNLN